MRFFRKIKSIYNRLFGYPQLSLRQSDYDDYWQDKCGDNLGLANCFQSDRARWIADRVNEGESVLDVGCGDGAVLLQIKRHKKIRALGADLSEVALQFLSGKGVETIRLDLTEPNNITELPVADYVLLLEVLEHLPDPELLLELIFDKADKGLFFSFPNSGYLMHRLRFLFGRFPVQWRLHPGEHLRFWTYRDLLWWIRELGYDGKCEVDTYQGIPLLNRLWPSVFAEALIVKINR